VNKGPLRFLPHYRAGDAPMKTAVPTSRSEHGGEGDAPQLSPRP